MHWTEKEEVHGKRFRLQVDEHLVRTIWFNGLSLWTHPNSIHWSLT